MTDSKSEEIQSELFQEFSSQPKKIERFPSISRTQKPILVSTSVEQIIFVGILLILVFCLVFFLGVIRGKSLTVVKSIAIQQPVSRMLVMPQYRPQGRPALGQPQNSQPVQKAPDARPDKPYMIQLVTYKRADLAERDALAFRRNGYTSTVVPSGDYYQVCVGQYATKDEAKKDLKYFGAKYKDCFLRRR